MIYITVPDINDSIGRIELYGKQFYIRFTYNSYGDFWNFGFYDSKMKPLLPMTRVVENCALNYYYTYTDFPNGIFGAVSSGRIGRDSFKDSSAKFVFLDEGELKEFGFYD